MESTEVLRDLHQEQIEQANGRAALVNPFAPDEGRRVTLEEYWAKWYEHPYPDIDVSYEWNNGILEAKPLANKRRSLTLATGFSTLLRQLLWIAHEIAEAYQYGDRLFHDDDGL